MFNSRRSAFTLIELLVVVAIIALLISMLLPALSQAKGQARKATCASNLHQIGIAMASYNAENNGWFPSTGEPPDGNWDRLDGDGWPVYYNIVWLYGGNAGQPDPATGQQSWANRPPQKRVMYKYIYPEFFQCPDDRPPEHIDTNGMSSYYNTGTSYIMNGYNWSTYATVFPKSYGRLGVLNRQASEITNPDCVVVGEVVMDEFWSYMEPFPGDYLRDGAGYRWHDRSKPMANVVCADASVRYVLINKTEGPRVQNPSYWWWEGKGYSYSFCPTAPGKRYEQPWYIRGH